MSEQQDDRSRTGDAPESRTNLPAKTGEGRPRRLDPFDLFEEMQNEMARLWGGAWPFGRAPSLRRLGGMRPTGLPRADVYERGNELIVKAELPGIRKEDVDLSIDNGDLVIRAERREEQEVKEESFYRMERQVGSVYRRLPLPEGVKPDQINATLADGVLEVRMPKPSAEEPQAKKIPVR